MTKEIKILVEKLLSNGEQLSIVFIHMQPCKADSGFLGPVYMEKSCPG